MIENHFFQENTLQIRMFDTGDAKENSTHIPNLYFGAKNVYIYMC